MATIAKFAVPRPQAGNRGGGGLANEVFADPVGPAIICENYIGSYCWDMLLIDLQDLQFKYFCGSSGLHGLQSCHGHCFDFVQGPLLLTRINFNPTMDK